MGFDHPAEIGELHRGITRRNTAAAAPPPRPGVAVTQAVQQCQPAHDGAAIGLHLGVRRDFGRRQVQHGCRGQRILD